MVLSKEYSEGVNARYAFQPLWVSGSKNLAKPVLETNNSSKANYPSETDKSSAIRLDKSELDKNVDLSLCGLAPAQSQMDLFLDKLCTRNKQRSVNFNQSEEAKSRVTASAMSFSGT